MAEPEAAQPQDDDGDQPSRFVTELGVDPVAVQGRPVHLTGKEYAILELLMLRRGTVLSKEYPHGIFGTRATYRWEPQPIIPVSGHAPDIATT